MRAIIIDDKDAKALLERLELTKYTEQHFKRENVTIDGMHRWFHYVVCSWLQEQGCSVNR